MLKNAIIVDGDPAMLSLVGNYLTNAKVENIQKFSNGEEALKTILASSCDIIILDWKLKKPSGPEVYNAIRANPDRVKLPILLISGSVTALGKTRTCLSKLVFNCLQHGP
jgi:two-component system chemotaxis response regulator CheY